MRRIRSGGRPCSHCVHQAPSINTRTGYVLLVRILEVVSGEPFHVFQKRRIFDVLDMKDTTDSTRFNGSGNMRTTIDDFVRWDRALWKQDRRLLSPDGYNMLFRRGKLDDGSPVDYGFGWFLEYEGDQLKFAKHGGWGSGMSAARNMVTRYAPDQIAVAAFAREHPEFGRRTENRRRLRDVVCDEIHEFIRSRDN
jgi:D-alanyl-D-alanine carboxypeptidase